MENPFFDPMVGMKDELAAMFEKAGGSAAAPSLSQGFSPKTDDTTQQSLSAGFGGGEKPDIGPIRQALVDRIQNEGSLGKAIGRIGQNQLTRSQQAFGMPSTQVATPSEQALGNQINAYETLVKATQLGSPEAKTMMDALKTFGLEGPAAQQAVEFIATNPDIANSMTENNVLTTVARVSRQLGLTGSGSAKSSIGKIMEDEKAGVLPPGTMQQYMTRQTSLPPSLVGPAAKPMPPQAIKAQNEALDAIGVANSINADLSKVRSQIDKGELDLGFFTNIGYGARNIYGNTTEQSRNFDSFKRTLEKMRNDSLRLNKGVQTEGDSVRAWNELVANITDNDLVSERLEEIESLNRRAAEIKKLEIQNLRSNYNQPEYDFSPYENLPTAIGGGKPRTPINSIPPQALDALLNDPSPEAQAEFDEVFGEGAAADALGG